MKSIISISAIISMFLFFSGISIAQHEHHGASTPMKRMVVEKNKPLNIPNQFKTQLDSLFNVYYQIQSSLSNDSLEDAKAGAVKIENALNSVDMKQLSGDPHVKWMEIYMGISENAGEIIKSKNIEQARLAFSELSKTAYLTAKTFGTSGNSALYYFHCPMAFDKKGAEWLQNDKTTKNPYFGKSMSGCGKMTETISTMKNL